MVTGLYNTHGSISTTLVGDYAAQAVVNTILGRAFPTDPIVGEEDAAELRRESGYALRNRIITLANEALTADLRPDETSEWGLGPGQTRTAEELLEAIDRGNDQGGRTGRGLSSIGVRSVFDLLWCRQMDARPYRWHKGVFTRRTVCRVSGANC